MRRKFFLGLRSRLFLLVMFAILPAMGLALYTGLDQRREASAQAQENALRLARLVASQQEQAVADIRQLLISLAQAPEVHQRDVLHCSDYLRTVIEETPKYANFGVIDLDGRVWCSAVPMQTDVQLADRSYFRRALQRRGFAVGDFQVGRITGKPSLNFGYPVWDESGQLSGVVYAALDLSWLNRMIASAQLPEGSVLSLVDAQGTILARYPDPEHWVGRNVPDSPVVKTVLEQRTEGILTEVGLDAVRRLYAFTTLGGRGSVARMFVLVGIPSAVALAEADRILTRNLTWLAMVGLLAVLGAWLMSQRLVFRPLNALVRTAHRLAGGDLRARTGLKRGPEELFQLAQTVDEMAEALERRIAEHQRTERILRESEQRLSLHFQQTPLGVIEWDMDFRAAKWNPAAERIFGFTEAEAMGRRADELIVPASVLPQVLPVWERLLQQRGGARSTNENVTKDGRLILCEWYNTPLVDPSGKVIGVASLVQDVTEQRRAEREIRQLNEELERRVRNRTAELEVANRELEAFSYSVSHDLRAPLRSIDGFSRLLMEDSQDRLPPHGREHLERVRRATQRMSQLIDGMMTLSRVARAEMRWETVDLSALAQGIAAELQNAEPERTVRFVIAPGLTDTGDVRLLHSALENLLGNAWKFTANRAAGLIEFGRTLEDGRSVYFVRDNGAGFNMAYVNKLFVAFQRLHLAEDFAGSGIGLATVHRIIQRHHGEVWAEGETEQGATFYFTLGRAPAGEGRPVDNAAVAASEAEPEGMRR